MRFAACLGERHFYARFDENIGRAAAGVDAVEIAGQVGRWREDHRNFRCRELLRDHPGLGAAVDDRFYSVFAAQLDEDFNVAGAVYAHEHGCNASDYILQCLEIRNVVPVAATHTAFVVNLVVAEVDRFIERIAQGEPGSGARAAGIIAAALTERDHHRRLRDDRARCHRRG